MSMKQSMVDLYWTKEINTNLKARGMDSIGGSYWDFWCGCTKYWQTLAVYSESTTSTMIAVSMIQVDSTSQFNEHEQYQLTWAGATGFKFLAIEATGGLDSTLLLQVLGINQIVVVKFYEDWEGWS